MFAVGHLAAGYLTGKITSKILHVDVKLPLILLLSILPDIDLAIPGLIHRGPTHSIITMAILSLPFFVVYRKAVIPYFIAAAQHSLIGDYLTGGGIQLFWPINTGWYGLQTCQMNTINVLNEWALFIISAATMLKLGEIRTLIEPHPWNIILIAPLSSLISPLLFGLPVPVPTSLFIPHIIYIILFSFSLLYEIIFLIKQLGSKTHIEFER